MFSILTHFDTLNVGFMGTLFYVGSVKNHRISFDFSFYMYSVDHSGGVVLGDHARSLAQSISG